MTCGYITINNKKKKKKKFLQWWAVEPDKFCWEARTK